MIELIQKLCASEMTSIELISWYLVMALILVCIVMSVTTELSKKVFAWLYRQTFGAYKNIARFYRVKKIMKRGES